MPRKKNRFAKARTLSSGAASTRTLPGPLITGFMRNVAQCGLNDSLIAQRISLLRLWGTGGSGGTPTVRTPCARLMYSIHTRTLDLVPSDYCPGLIIRAPTLRHRRWDNVHDIIIQTSQYRLKTRFKCVANRERC